MIENDRFKKLKEETLILLNKRKTLLTIALVFLGIFAVLFTLSMVVLVGAIDGQLHYTAAYILLTAALEALAASIAILIIRHARYKKELIRRQESINGHIDQIKQNNKNPNINVD